MIELLLIETQNFLAKMTLKQKLEKMVAYHLFFFQAKERGEREKAKRDFLIFRNHIIKNYSGRIKH